MSEVTRSLTMASCAFCALAALAPTVAVSAAAVAARSRCQANTAGAIMVRPMSRAVLPKLRILDLACPPSWFSNFSVSRYPALEWCFVSLDGESSARFFGQFDAAPALKGLGLAGVRSQKTTLKAMRTDISALRLQEIHTARFVMGDLGLFRELRYLEIADCRAPLDCGLLEDLPLLEELSLQACDEITGFPSLLKLPHLKKLRLSDRVRPYAKDMPRGLEEKLRTAIPEIMME